MSASLSASTPIPAHAVSRLRATRLAASSKPFVARGGGSVRCPQCRLVHSHCICSLKPSAAVRAGFCLLMGDIEALKPSNTGWLIADLVPDTHAFAWSRTVVDPALTSLLSDPQWQPVVVFPADYADPERVVRAWPAPANAAPANGSRRPLFVLLDGTWAEARKMFRKSTYLSQLPVLALQPQSASVYRLRQASKGHHLCTAEVAALCLEQAGEPQAGALLAAWLDVFSEHSLSVRKCRTLDYGSVAHQRLRTLAAGRSWHPA
ncbi:MAG: DTW domain-containing protein [Hydrogenophaga sp.]|nr:DTW domain-containing protein [Hydrogenophaga sp.]